MQSSAFSLSSFRRSRALDSRVAQAAGAGLVAPSCILTVCAFYAVVWLILGIGSSIRVTVTGHQCWHVITAGSFFGLFWTELNFIIKVVPNSYTSSSQASV